MALISIHFVPHFFASVQLVFKSLHAPYWNGQPRIQFDTLYLRKSSNKHISEKDNKSSVLLLSMISTTEKNNFKMKKENSSLYSDSDYCPGFLLQPLDLVIQEAKHQLMHEKLCEKEMKNFDVGKYSDKCTQGSISKP